MIWKAFQYFTFYGLQARAIECVFSVLRNPVNGNIILYDVYGRPLHMSNVMNVHTGMIYLDIPKKCRHGATGNWFPYMCAVYSVLAILSGFVVKSKEKNISQEEIIMNISKKVIGLLLAAFVVFSFAVCSSAAEAGRTPADLVVYGKIFTSESNQLAEAFAVKDGKYVYVGDKKGAEALVKDGKTDILVRVL